MRIPLLSRVAGLVLFGAALPALAAPVVFSYSGAIQTWTASVAGTYVITAVGAQGGHGIGGFVGGRGASITGSFDLLAGQTFQLAVGGAGQSSSGNSGGGGGTFFVGAGSTPLLVAGGGGGIRQYASQNGCDASLTAYGIQGSGYYSTSTCLAKSDDLGLGGDVVYSSYGSGGAGFNGDGADDYGNGGDRWAAGMAGGNGGICGAANGGFGGGGSGSGCYGGGGGGGYSGGDGSYIGGGGGSWNTGYDQLAVSGVGYGNGSLSINLISTAKDLPEPSVLSLLALALLALGLTSRKRG